MDIIKTWPAFMEPRKVLTIFNYDKWARFYFTLGRGKPQQEVTRLWYTYRGRILGSMLIEELVQNDGSLPKLTSLSGEESSWQIKRDNWVVVCVPPMQRLREKLYMSGFRGWHYFDIDSWRGEIESRIAI